MDASAKKFLYAMLKTPSAPGREEEVQDVVRKRMKGFADHMETDLHGNLMVAINPDAKRKIMLAGHADQIALMITHITSDGFLLFAGIGGIDVGVLPGTRITVHAAKGAINGVIGRRPIHLQKSEERGKVDPDINKHWIDIGAKNKKDAESKVELGEFATFQLDVHELSNDLVCSPGLDNKVGVFVAMEALRLCHKAKIKVGLFAVSTVQEEIGLRGAVTSAYKINPEIGIGIDVTHANDNPGKGENKSAPCILGKGPTITRGPNSNLKVEKLLHDTAKKLKIPVQIAPSPGPLGNDTNAIQLARGGSATASVGLPNRYMHTQAEVCSLKDLEGAAKLLAGFVKAITPKTSFIP